MSFHTHIYSEYSNALLSHNCYLFIINKLEYTDFKMEQNKYDLYSHYSKDTTVYILPDFFQYMCVFLNSN